MARWQGIAKGTGLFVLGIMVGGLGSSGSQQATQIRPTVTPAVLSASAKAKEATPTPTINATATPKPAVAPTAAPVTSSSTSGSGYTNSAGNHVNSPVQAPSIPAGATAQCGDGSYSFSQTHSGTCSHHGGVSRWL